MATKRRTLLPLHQVDLNSIAWNAHTKAQKLTYARRLRRLAELLNTLPRKQFHFEKWVSRYNPRQSCGTVCCALGWAAAWQRRHFRGLGLKIDPVQKVMVSKHYAPLDSYWTEADAYFGEGAFEHIFTNNYLYQNNGGRSTSYEVEDITRSMVVRRLKEMAGHWEQHAQD